MKTLGSHIISNKLLWLFFLLLSVTNFPSFALSLDTHLSRALLKDISFDKENYLTNLSRDSYFILDELDVPRQQACGMSITLTFKEALLKPAIFELYWRGHEDSFSDVNKALLIINQEHSKDTKTYLFSLCDLLTFRHNLEHQDNLAELRFDYPADRQLTIKFDSAELLDTQTLVSKTNKLTPTMVKLVAYERVPANLFLSFKTITYKLLLALKEARERLTDDVAFLIVWLSLMAVLVVLLLRSVIRQQGNNKQR